MEGFDSQGSWIDMSIPYKKGYFGVCGAFDRSLGIIVGINWNK